MRAFNGPLSEYRIEWLGFSRRQSGHQTIYIIFHTNTMYEAKQPAEINYDHFKNS